MCEGHVLPLPAAGASKALFDFDSCCSNFSFSPLRTGQLLTTKQLGALLGLEKQAVHSKDCGIVYVVSPVLSDCTFLVDAACQAALSVGSVLV